MMSRRELCERRQRLQRKLAASFEGWHSGRVDRLEEALRVIEFELDDTRSAESAQAPAALFLHRFAPRSRPTVAHRRAQ